MIRASTRPGTPHPHRHTRRNRTRVARHNASHRCPVGDDTISNGPAAATLSRPRSSLPCPAANRRRVAAFSASSSASSRAEAPPVNPAPCGGAFHRAPRGSGPLERGRASDHTNRGRQISRDRAVAGGPRQNLGICASSHHGSGPVSMGGLTGPSAALVLGQRRARSTPRPCRPFRFEARASASGPD